MDFVTDFIAFVFIGSICTYLLAIIIGLFNSIFRLFFKKPDKPSQLAKILGPILIFLSYLEIAFPFIVIKIMVTQFELVDSDFKELGTLLVVCFLCCIVGVTLSFNYYKRYYLNPKGKRINNAIKHKQNVQIIETATDNQFQPKYFSSDKS